MNCRKYCQKCGEPLVGGLCAFCQSDFEHGDDLKEFKRLCQVLNKSIYWCRRLNKMGKSPTTQQEDDFEKRVREPLDKEYEKLTTLGIERDVLVNIFENSI